MIKGIYWGSRTDENEQEQHCSEICRSLPSMLFYDNTNNFIKKYSYWMCWKKLFKNHGYNKCIILALAKYSADGSLNLSKHTFGLWMLPELLMGYPPSISEIYNLNSIRFFLTGFILRFTSENDVFLSKFRAFGHKLS